MLSIHASALSNIVSKVGFFRGELCLVKVLDLGIRIYALQMFEFEGKGRSVIVIGIESGKAPPGKE